MTERHIPLITQSRMHDVIDSVYHSHDMQTFISAMIHAQTCKDCSPFFVEAMSRAKYHMIEELR